ncbi:MAG: hypothetical protein ACI9UJ_001379 [bacterium]|jgi:hypothetical protein
MKNIILATVAVLTLSTCSFSQSAFTDGAEYFTLRRGIQLGTVTYSSYFKETVRLDSVIKGDEYYTIFRNKEDSKSWKNLDTLSYKLRVTDRKVYYTGNFYTDTNRIMHTVKDVLFYDFGLDKGDTLFSFDPQSENLQAYTCIIDSVKIKTYQDGKPRVTQYARGFKESFPNRPFGYFRFIEGVGSSRGILYQNIIGYPPDLSLISICKDKDIFYLDSSFYHYTPGDYCDESHIQNMTYRSANVPRENKPITHIDIYPNPVSTTLFISDELKGTYKISNEIGEMITVGDASKPIDVSSLPPQLYFIHIFTEEVVATAKFIKVN